MTDRSRCIRCERAIDAWAGICPFCNWNQAQPLPAPGTTAPRIAAVQYTPPQPMDVKRLIAIASGVVISLVLAFLVGMVINRDGAPKRAPDVLEEQAQEHNTENLKPKRADTPLVPAGQGGIENEPITSAPIVMPAGQVPNEYQRTDATAVSADEYTLMAKRAQAERKTKNVAVLVDPRSISGAAYAQGQSALPQRPRQTAEPSVRKISRTRPIAEYQPIPPTRGRGTARFTLIVGADGRVKSINVEQMLRGGNNPALVRAIQSWRFKPATENGEPVAAPYSVEISFDRE
ncbi:MAG TPA: energy transducer TonB [Thermoanaerobaculia bacterium]|jgi:hypothetical protein|nr:energy transducer TonB [Thermoanaerobaculia bacterium]